MSTVPLAALLSRWAQSWLLFVGSGGMHLKPATKLAFAFATALVLAAGLVGAEAAPTTSVVPSLSTSSGSSSTATGTLDPALAQAHDLVASSAYATLETALSALPGFEALTPSLTQPGTLVAVFSGSVPWSASLIAVP